MKKIRTITFHASYNFGSNLQAYALQEYIKQIFKKNNEKVDYKIINLRTKKQREIYNYRTDSTGVKKYLKSILFGHKLKIREKKFEEFINTKLDITNKMYDSINKLEDEDVADYYISGSDQLWNANALDFSWAYFLDFVQSGKKISYSASFGAKDHILDKKSEERLMALISKYDYLSVREEKSYNRVNKYLPDKECNINVDPTILLTKEEWTNRLLKDQKKIDSEYILFYTLRMNKDRVRLVKELSKTLKLPVVVLNPACMYDILGGFIRKYDSGPIEFLNYIKNSKLVVSSSFHGTLFSILFNKPFYSIDGIKDFRIATLLKKTGLEDRSISINDSIRRKLDNLSNINFNKVNKVFEMERRKSEDYLIKALDIK